MVFPELYRLYDKEAETGENISPKELRHLVDLCSFCALCPCPPVRAKIVEAKTSFIDRDGLKFGVRALEDVERLAKICSTNTSFTNVSGRMVYYPPCHLREQNIGRPYQELLSLLPDIDLEPIDGALDCCGMAGIMGFKKVFHESSVQLGKRLMHKIKQAQPDRLVTDCLSCRLQFKQLLPYEVYHPIELLKESYELHRQ